MSANAAIEIGMIPAPAGLPEREQPTRLRPVTTKTVKKARPKIAYALVVVTGVFCIVVAQLLLSVGLSQGAYELSSLENRQTQLGWEKQALAGEVEQVSSPQYIAANAQALGMVIGGTPAYLRLSDAGVVGVPSSASGEAPLQLGSSSLVGNVLIDDLSLVTVPNQVVDPDAAATSESDAPEQPTTISLENGLPSPNTR